MVEPIRPEQVADAQDSRLPDGVLRAFNNLIIKTMHGNTATVFQKDALAAVCAEMDCDKQTVFSNRWLDVESVYRKAGWDVVYDKPAYCESYDAFFKFNRRK